MSSKAVTKDLTEEQKKQALITASDLRIKQTVSDKAPNNFVQSIKNSALFQSNWDQLLSAAPMSLSLLGACMIASSSSSANVELVKPSGGFKFLSYVSLRANLVQVTDIGRNTFLLAERNMDGIALKSQALYDVIDDILSDLSGTPEDAKLGLDLHMSLLKRGAADCKNAAMDVDAAFTHWLDYVSELHQVAEETQGDNQSKQLANETKLLAEKAKLELTKKAEATGQKAVESLADTMKTTQEAFKKASDNFPSGWDIIGMEFVSGLTKTLLGATNSFVQKQTGAPQQSQQPNDPKNPPLRPQTLPPNYDDPAYSQIQTTIEPVKSLRAVCVGGEKGGVDWKAAAGSGQQTLGYIQSMLEFAKNTFKSTGQGPSVAYVSIINDGLSLIHELQAVCAGSNGVSWNPPAADSPQVKQWQAKAGDIFNRASALSSTANSMPGVGGANVPLVNQGQTNNQPGGGGVAEQILNSATTRLNETQEAFTKSQEIYQKATHDLIETQKNLGEIKAALEKLSADKVTMEEIKAILIKCIQTIIDLKAEITKLVQFFDALATLVDFATEYQVKPFIEYLDRLISGAMKQQSISGFSFSDLQRQTVYMSCLIIRAYYSVFRSVALMYTKISREWITPGVTLVNALSAHTDDQQQLIAKRNKLSQFTEEAAKRIKETVSEAQAKILNNMASKVQDIAADTKLLPGVPQDTKKAIEQGAKVVQDAASKGMDDYKPLSTKPLNAKFDDD